MKNHIVSGSGID